MLNCHDWDLLVEATECNRDFVSLDSLRTWYESPYNIMLIEGKDVGIATLEYPGMYSVHWYFQTARGRAAIDLGKAMVEELFKSHGAITLRAFIKTRLKASKWACRQVGFKSLGNLVFPDGDENELFYMTIKDFEQGKDQ